jgi:hypothetical protein
MAREIASSTRRLERGRIDELGMPLDPSDGLRPRCLILSAFTLAHAASIINPSLRPALDDRPTRPARVPFQVRLTQVSVRDKK